MTPPRARSVVLDADSTLAGIEGIDWLAARRPPSVARRIAGLTAAAMEGKKPLEQVYGQRLDEVMPSHQEVSELADAYVAALAPGARECVAALQAAGLDVVIVSGGIRQALLKMAALLGVAEKDVHAVDLRFDPIGRYWGFDEESPLTQSHGKARLVGTLALPSPVFAVGDGGTDLEIRLGGACELFVAYTGFTRRASVVARADRVCDSFSTLQRFILGGP